MVKEEKANSEIKKNVQSFVNTYAKYLEAHPHENQAIFDHVWEQANRPGFGPPRHEFIKGDRGFERIITLQNKMIHVHKRVFHMTKMEAIAGVDFVISKVAKNKLSIVAIQVKRNRGKDYFAFSKNEMKQLKRFGKAFPNGYYLFVDETGDSPYEYFVRLREVKYLLTHEDHKNISNEDVRAYSRGYKIFYDAFYSCRKGTASDEITLIKKSRDYVNDTNRVITQLIAKNITENGRSISDILNEIRYNRTSKKLNHS